MRKLVAALLVACALAPAAAHAAGAATAPTQVARIGKQRIAYRSIGSGRPVVFIQGLAGTMDGWPPSFVDAVAARHHRVIVFDNEGVGRSTLRPGLTIRHMAQDTARLVQALHLRRPDVLGWSMGGMIAQSYAVRFPRMLRKLVLLSTASGDGKATLPQGAALAALGSGDAGSLLQFLFPPDDVQARDSYISDLLTRMDLNPIAPPAVVTAQIGASGQWLSGGDPDGARVGGLRAHALVGGGALDQLLPVVDQRHLAALIPHARLITYPDAAHGFFIQHASDFVPQLTAFLR